MTFTARQLYSVMAFGALTALGVTARAQSSTGGASGAATLTDADIYVNIQRKEGVNLNERERALFLNRSNCQCGTDAWVRAVIQPAAAARAAAISPSASVSLYVGNACDPVSTVSCCHRLASVTFSEFRLNGISVKTTVDKLVREWSASSGSCREVINDTLIGSGASVVSGTGGAGTGGAGGTSGDTGTSGNGGAGTGGAGTGGTTTNRPVAACDGPTFTQTLNVFIGTTGEGTRDVGLKALGFSVDPVPPPAPANVVVAGVNQALQVSWTGLTTAEASDLLGYQALCTRGEATQVFKDGTFTAGFDACPAASSSWPGFGALPTSAFVCSDLLPTSATSTRLKILENDINYYVGMAAVDKQRNASLVNFKVQKPILTKDFYFEYRNGDPQGAASGGFCSVSGAAGGLTTVAGLGAGLLTAVVVARIRRRRSERRRSES